MKSDRLTDARIMAVIRQAEGGISLPELCREHGISNAGFTSGPGNMAAWMLR